MNHAIIADDAQLGPRATVDAFSVIGVDGPDDQVTVLGADAHVRSHSVIYRGVRAGDRLVTGHQAIIREGTTLGDDCSVGGRVTLLSDNVIGDGVRFHDLAMTGEGTVIEDGAWIGPYAMLVNSRHPNTPGSHERFEPVVVRRNAILGIAALIMPGVEIGAGSVVGADAFVREDVPPGVVVVGNPARVLREVR